MGGRIKISLSLWHPPISVPHGMEDRKEGKKMSPNIPLSSELTPKISGPFW